MGPEFLGLSCGSSVLQRWIASVYVAQIWCRCGAVAYGIIVVQLWFSFGSDLVQHGVARCYIMQIWFSKFSLGSVVVQLV